MEVDPKNKTFYHYNMERNREQNNLTWILWEKIHVEFLLSMNIDMIMLPVNKYNISVSSTACVVTLHTVRDEV